jgi:hypothetical protein
VEQGGQARRHQGGLIVTAAENSISAAQAAVTRPPGSDDTATKFGDRGFVFTICERHDTLLHGIVFFTPRPQWVLTGLPVRRPYVSFRRVRTWSAKRAR